MVLRETMALIVADNYVLIDNLKKIKFKWMEQPTFVHRNEQLLGELV